MSQPTHFRLAGRILGVLAMAVILGVCSLNFAESDQQKKKKPKAKKESGPLKVSVVLPEGPVTVGRVNTGVHAVLVKLENTSKQEIRVWPFLSVELLDSKGKPVKRTRSLGRFGRRSTDSVIESTKFAAVAPGKSYEIKINLKQYMSDPKLIVGWQVPGPGEYQLKMHYKYDRDEVKKEYGKGCKVLDAPNMPWNQAIELEKKMAVKLNVK